ncbi:hypothetical protein K3163_01645 [Qipengyuania sp. 1NDW9]|uniref:thermonuclease family protein n=1 Tax=Qipengyuania xiapuensis TaxID=2867236 RepID=UPI001C887018|nr:hypothetical protein [Qipengyuania xiapuensis]MBX7491907.1 hypothetical protein [Qipengyuania xiapuensis]
MTKGNRFGPGGRRKRAWRSGSDYRRRRKTPPRPARFGKRNGQSPGRSTRGGWLTAALALGLVLAAAFYEDPASFGAPGFMLGDAERVTAGFAKCGRGDWTGGTACVSDGDTFRLAGRRIRVVGIDTAEKDARCPAEAMLANRSTEALLTWLNRGPFDMRAKAGEDRDKYGRDLRTISRTQPDGSTDWLADYMIEQGGARRYLGGWRGSWC